MGYFFPHLFVLMLFSHLHNVCTCKSKVQQNSDWQSASNHVAIFLKIRSSLKRHIRFPETHRNGHPHPFSDLIESSQAWKRGTPFAANWQGDLCVCVWATVCLEKYIPSEHTRTLTETFTYTHIEEFLPTEQTVKALNHVLCLKIYFMYLHTEIEVLHHVW